MAVLPTWRQELFLRSPAEQLRDLAPLLQRHRLASLNLPNKSKGELPALLERCRALRAALPAPVDVCCHYAINHNYHRTADASFAALERFCTDLAAIGTCYSLLLVSGGGPRRKGLDSLSALQRIVISPALRQLRLPLAVAFNPYLPGEEQQAEERRRLRAKLEAGRGLVTAVYLQAGSDVDLLDAGLLYLNRLLDELGQQQTAEQPTKEQPAEQPARPAKRQKREQLPPGGQQQQEQQQLQLQQQEEEERDRSTVRPAADSSLQLASAEVTGSPCCRHERPAVHASVLVPSKKLLAQMRFRPWGGVFLSERYLSSIEAADAITMDLLRVLARHGATPLIETEVACDADVERAQQLLKAAAR